MSKLLERLRDPVRSGVYRAQDDAAIRDALKGGDLSIHGVSLEGIQDKLALLDRIAAKLHFPEWFGRNWDALKDSLADLSWLEATGHVVFFRNYENVPGDDFAVLLEILDDVASIWREHGECFFVVFIDPERRLDLLDLYRGA